MYSGLKKLLFFIFSVFFISAKCQNSNDSINSLISKKYSELDSLYYSTKYGAKKDSLKCVLYAKAYFKKALKHKDTLETISGKFLLADIKNDPSIYLNFCDSLIAEYSKNPSKKFPAEIHVEKIHYYAARCKDEMAQEQILLAQKSLKAKPNKELENILYIYTGYLKARVHKYEECINLLKKAYYYGLKNNIAETNDFYLNLPNSIATAYEMSNQIDSANFYCNKSIQLYSKLKDTLLLANTHYVKGKIEFKNNNYTSSIEYFKKFIPHLIIDENFNGLIKTYAFIGVAYDSLKKLRKAYEYHFKADSIYNLKGIINPPIESSYTFLIKNAKSNNDLKQQLAAEIGAFFPPC